MTPHVVAVLLRDACNSLRHMFGSYLYWGSFTVDYPHRIWVRLQEPLYIESYIWPTVRLMLKDNIYNKDWAMGCIVLIATLQVLQDDATEPITEAP
jgi:hypothetical protein